MSRVRPAEGRERGGPPLQATLEVPSEEVSSLIPLISLNLLAPDILNGLFTALLQAASPTLSAPRAAGTSPSTHPGQQPPHHPARGGTRPLRGSPGPPRSACTRERPGGAGAEDAAGRASSASRPSGPPPDPHPRSPDRAGRPREARVGGAGTRGSRQAGRRGLRAAGTRGAAR